METILEKCVTVEQRFLWEKVLNVKDIHKEIFRVHGGKCLWRKAVHKWADKLLLGGKSFADDEEVET
jgi:hypothetical protein